MNICHTRRAAPIHDQFFSPFPFTLYPRMAALKMVAEAHVNTDILLLPQGHERVVKSWHFTLHQY